MASGSSDAAQLPCAATGAKDFAFISAPAVRAAAAVRVNTPSTRIRPVAETVSVPELARSLRSRNVSPLVTDTVPLFRRVSADSVLGCTVSEPRPSRSA